MVVVPVAGSMVIPFIVPPEAVNVMAPLAFPLHCVDSEVTVTVWPKVSDTLSINIRTKPTDKK
jgi:hypothetical protein